MQRAITEAGDDLDAIMQAVVDGALRVMPHATGAIVEMRDGAELVYRAASGTSAGKVGLRLRLLGSLSGHCITRGRTQVCEDSETDPRVDREACRRVGLRSMIIVPLPFRGDNVGVLKVYSSSPAAFDARDLLTAQLLAGPIAMGLASAAHASMSREKADADRRFAATFDQAAVGIAHVAPDGRFLLVNDRFCEVTGWSRDELVAGGFQAITHPDDLKSDLDNVTALIDGRLTHYAMEKRYLRKDGGQVWVNLTVSLVRDGAGSPDFFVSVAEDITARKAAEEAATHDALTGLPNRRWLLERLKRELERQRRSSTPLAVAYLDLDGFKAVNDAHGHAEGDNCLKLVTDALRSALRPGDVVARLSGDEFVVLLPSTAQHGAEVALRRLQTAVRRVSHGKLWRIAASVGAVVIAAGARVDTEQVLGAADLLMYRMKRTAGERLLVEPLIEAEQLSWSD
jgi:diguanylate cyclase (GGDEF)-like protein/PAS domain S-box-containing protein